MSPPDDFDQSDPRHQGPPLSSEGRRMDPSRKDSSYSGTEISNIIDKRQTLDSLGAGEAAPKALNDLMGNPTVDWGNMKDTACSMPGRTSNDHTWPPGAKSSTANETAPNASNCRFCTRSFRTEDLARRHERRHFERSPQEFPCLFSECEITFSSLDDLERHIEGSHRSTLLDPSM